MTKNIKALLSLLLFLLAGNAYSTTISREFYFEAPEVAGGNEGFFIKADGCGSFSDPGMPVIPFRPVCIAIPPFEEIVSIQFETAGYDTLVGYYQIVPGPPQAPIENRYSVESFRNMNIYGSDRAYPESAGKLASDQLLSGIRLAFLNIYPCRINPARGSVMYTSLIRVVIDTAPALKEEAPHPRGAVISAATRIESIVDNPAVLSDYVRGASSKPAEPFRPVDGLSGTDCAEEQSTYPYIIITNDDLEEYFRPLESLKTSMGLRAKIVTREWIETNHEGADIQEKIRDFIAYSYFNWNTLFVLLGGDDEIIPHRGLYVKAGSEIDTDIPSDLYYAAIDGSWNSDGDSYFGEPGEEDLLPEVSLGRIPVSSQVEIENFTSKLHSYSLEPVIDDCLKAVMLGEFLWDYDGEITWGGDYKDEILYGSTNYDLETGGMPAEFNSTVLYDRDLSIPWGKGDIIDALNAGVNLVNHLGHAGLHNVMRMTSEDISLLSNDGSTSSPAVVYSQGCYSAAFDNRDEAGGYWEEDAIGENFVTAQAGAVAYVGNTRLGWNSPGSTCGVSQFFDRQFFDALFRERLGTIGWVFDDSRIDNIPYIQYALFRYVMYELCLFGDPSMGVWTSPPSQLNVYHKDSITPGCNDFSVEVSDIEGAVAGALVSIFNSDYSFYEIGSTATDGRTSFPSSICDTGQVYVKVFSPGHFVYTDSIPVEYSPELLAELPSVYIDDDSLGASSGDGDGLAESGEKVEVGFILANAGTAEIDSCIVVLSCSDPYITVLDSISDMIVLPARTSIIDEREYLLEFSPQVPGSRTVELSFRIFTPHEEWNSRHTIFVNAPRVSLDYFATSDTLLGNGNGCVEAWEFVNIDMIWTNNGSVDIQSPELTLMIPDQSHCRPYKHSASLPPLAIGQSVVSSNELSFFVKRFTPPFTDISLIIELDEDNLATHTETLTVTTCGYSIDDSADSPGFWKHKAVIGVDGWHISEEDFYSSPSSWKCGSGDIEEDYPNMMEATLTSPPLCLGENSKLSFWYSIDAEAGSTYPYWAEDGAVVEISTDGGDSWTIISPEDNYPCRASASNTIFLDPYQRCYSGQRGWEFEEYDLSPFSGPVSIRFHFASNEQYGFDGIYLDDIVISTERYTAAEDDDQLPGFINNLLGAYPNPFNPATTIKYEVAEMSAVQIMIFDVSGRAVRTLLDEVVERGVHEIIWDGRDNRGNRLASNVYFCRLRVGDFTSTQRLVLLR